MKIKNIIIQFIAAFALCLTAAAQTPTYQYVDLLPDTNATVQGSSINTLGTIIDCRKQQQVGITVRYKNTTNVADAVTLLIAPSLDGVYYDTNRATPLLFTAIATAGNLTSMSTNINTAGYGYYKCLWITNAGVGAVPSAKTNLMIGYSQKKSAP